MKFIPILFSTPMVNAIMRGDKTMTRRLIKTPKNKLAAGFRINTSKDGANKWPEAIDENERGLEGNGCNMECPYGQIGDVLWVRETWSRWANEPYKYKADGTTGYSWKPSIHMPKAACRIFLEITNIRVEWLQDITENDAISEGVENLGLYPGYDVSSRGKFEGLWNLINGDESWDKNPLVWVIEFKRMEKPSNFL